jgi:hypothetical protein
MSQFSFEVPRKLAMFEDKFSACLQEGATQERIKHV